MILCLCAFPAFVDSDDEGANPQDGHGHEFPQPDPDLNAPVSPFPRAPRLHHARAAGPALAALLASRFLEVH